MNELPQPFVTAVFTATSHHPFQIPKRYADVYKEGPVPITKCIQYTDNAIRLFFNRVKNYDWFKNTIFVITADHKLFSVPILFYGDVINKKEVRNQLDCQADVMPTLLDAIHYPKPFVAFGNSVLQPDSLNYVVNFNDQIYNIFQGNYFLLFDGNNQTGFYDYINDPMLKNNIMGKFPDIEQRMLNVLKAEIQQYHVRMIENKLAEP